MRTKGAQIRSHLALCVSHTHHHLTHPPPPTPITSTHTSEQPASAELVFQCATLLPPPTPLFFPLTAGNLYWKWNTPPHHKRKTHSRTHSTAQINTLGCFTKSQSIWQKGRRRERCTVVNTPTHRGLPPLCTQIVRSPVGREGHHPRRVRWGKGDPVSIHITASRGGCFWFKGRRAGRCLTSPGRQGSDGRASGSHQTSPGGFRPASPPSLRPTSAASRIWLWLSLSIVLLLLGPDSSFTWCSHMTQHLTHPPPFPLCSLLFSSAAGKEAKWKATEKEAISAP